MALSKHKNYDNFSIPFGKIIEIKYVNGIENYLPAVVVFDLIFSSSSVASHCHLRFQKKLSDCETIVVRIAEGPKRYVW